VFRNLEIKINYSFKLIATIALLGSGLVSAQELDETEQHTSEYSGFKPKNSQVSSFFNQNKTSQNFFENRNISSNSIFGNSNGAPVLDLQNSGFNNQVQEVPKNSEEKPLETSEINNSPKSAEPVNQVEEIAEPEANSVASSEMDSSMKDVMEHSKKIREAIFGAGAADKLPVAIREKLKEKSPASSGGSTRF
jgi:hypothetical protein